MKKHIGLLLILLFAGATTALAQPWSGLGVHAGGTAALLRGDNVGITDNTTDRNLGFTVGLYKAVPIGAGFEVLPEVMYVQKGGELSLDETINGNTTESELIFNLDYVEVPVTLSYAIPTQSPRYVPMLYAGPYVGWTARRNATFEVEGGDVSVDADDAFREFDYGAVFGADLGVKMRKRMATIGVRYDLGLADIARDGEAVEGVALQNEARTDEWSILVGFRI